MSKKYDIAVCMPCLSRPQRTARAIESILAQTTNNWQAIIIGDNCIDFANIVKHNRELGDNSWESRAKKAGNDLILMNWATRCGGYGSAARNYAIDTNDASNLCFLDNDDYFEPDHFKNTLNRIKTNPDGYVDFIVQSTNCRFANYIRHPKIQEGYVGHSELVIKSDFLRLNHQIKERSFYGHDWDLIKQMIDAGATYSVIHCDNPTYNVMGAGDLRETNID